MEGSNNKSKLIESQDWRKKIKSELVWNQLFCKTQGICLEFFLSFKLFDVYTIHACSKLYPPCWLDAYNIQISQNSIHHSRTIAAPGKLLQLGIYVLYISLPQQQVGKHEKWMMVLPQCISTASAICIPRNLWQKKDSWAITCTVISQSLFLYLAAIISWRNDKTKYKEFRSSPTNYFF